MIKDTFRPVKLKLTELKRYIAAFLDTLQNLSPETQGTYKRSLNAFLAFFVQDRRFFFRVRDVERYRTFLQQQRKLKEATVATYLTALRRFCQFLVAEGVLEKNPALRVIGGRRPQRHHRMYLRLEEIQKLLESIDTGDEIGLRDKAIILVMLGCACSEREIMYADVGDLQQQDKRWILYVQGKGRTVKDEVVPVPKAVVEAIMAYLDRRRLSEELSADTPLFVSYSNRSYRQRMTIRGIREAISERLRQSGIKQDRERLITPFSIRHTAGILLAEADMPVEEFMERMRIKWRPTAMQYYRLRGVLQSDRYPQLRAMIQVEK